MLKIRFFILYLFAYQACAQISDFEHINFSTADSLASSYREASLDYLAALSHNLTSSLNTDVEKTRAIYMWICTNIANNYRLYNKNMRKRNRYRKDSIKLYAWNKRFKEIAIKSLLEKKSTICTGYAYIFNELLELAGIESRIIHGYAKTSTIDISTLFGPNHSWNAVLLNNKWYLCDPTWASGIQDSHTMRFEFNFTEGYFLSNPDLFALNHYPIEEEWLLLDDKDFSFDDFIEAPILYTKTYKYLDRLFLPVNFHNEVIKNEKVVFKYSFQEQYHNTDALKLVLFDGNSNKEIKTDLFKTEGNILEFTHIFKRKGFYDVHLYIEKDIIITYTFKVKKMKN